MVYAEVPEHAGLNDGQAQQEPRPVTTDGWLERISDQLQVFVDKLQELTDEDADGGEDGDEDGSTTRRTIVTEPDPGTGEKPAAEPKGNASTEEWVAYAKAKGATEDDLKDERGEPLGQKALREKYGTAAS